MFYGTNVCAIELMKYHYSSGHSFSFGVNLRKSGCVISMSKEYSLL